MIISKEHLKLFMAFFAICNLCLMPVHAWAQRATPQVIVAPVKKEQFYDVIEALGTLRANETVALTSTVTEKVTDVNFEDGQRVEKGDALIEMTSREEAAELDAQQAILSEAKAQLDRVELLVKSGNASQSLLEERRKNYDTARARLMAIQSRISDRLITAPFSGVVGIRNISVGAVLQPGTVITTLDDDSVMKLDFPIPSRYLSTIQKDLPVTARTDAYPDKEFKGKIFSINSQIDDVSRAITARAIIPNEERLLKPGLLMSLEIHANDRTTLLVPEEAIIPLGKKTYVFLIEDNGPDGKKVKRTEVTTGSRQKGIIEITSGIKEGDQVVIHGGLKISDGNDVIVRAIKDNNQSLSELLNAGKD
jgi:membrane fusion protein (multidrug efflux system)